MSARPTNPSLKMPSAHEDQEMIPQDPPARIARWTAALLIFLFITTVVAAFIVRIPETIRCGFVLVPRAGADPIQAPISGRVSHIKAIEGEEIEEGAVLFVLDSEEIRSAQTLLRTVTEDLRVLEQKTARLEELYNAEVSIKQEEMRELDEVVGFRTKHTATAKDYLARMESLRQAGLLSEIELLHHKLELAESEKDLNVSQKTVQQTKLQLKQLEVERVRRRTEEEGDLTKLRLQLASLERQLKNADGDSMAVRAPYRAVVLSTTHRNPGAVVQKGQELCQLARLEGALSASLVVQEAGVPRLAPGQQVRFFFDAFPYQRFGTISGHLDWLSPASVGSGSAAQFIARATLERRGFASKLEARPLRAGMRGEARIIVGQRTLIEYVFDPIRQLREQTRS